jgi:peptidoglycan/xylan/chitin deacetylase (PgdA/CDA1 family)
MRPLFGSQEKSERKRKHCKGRSMMIDPLSGRLLADAGLVSANQGRGPVVLMYHSISPEKKTPTDKWCVSARNFEKQLYLLKRKGWTTVCVRDLLMADLLPPRTVVITFDDGYEDNFEHGFRLLTKYGMCGTFFIVSRKIGEPSRLDAQQLRQMTASGMEIGAHTRTHARLPELSIEEIEDEVSGSKKDLEDLLDLPITSFAYPYGLLNDACVDMVRKAGFSMACSTRTGWFGNEPDPLRVRRVGVFANDTLSIFVRKLAFAGTNVSWKYVADYFIGRLRSRVLGYEPR